MFFRRIDDERKDIFSALSIYNSNGDFLLHHLAMPAVKKEFILNEIKEMEEHGFCSNLLIDRDEVIGIIDYKQQPDRYVYLSLLMLEKSIQGKGKGTEAYKTFEKKVVEDGAKKIRIDVVDDHEPNVLPFWEKQGFSAVGRDKLTWGEKTSSVVIMEKTL